MKGILLRVGIDQTYGSWNAPVDPISNEFVYFPIPDECSDFTNGMKTEYELFRGDLETFASDKGISEVLHFPAWLENECCHLDPDFSTLSYGDQGVGRGNKIGRLEKGDFIAFFASLKPTAPCQHNLIYALIGIYFVDKLEKAIQVEDVDCYKNAHTRRQVISETDLVVTADASRSGRFTRSIPIGELRRNAYRVTEELLEVWGGLDIKDGFIQRSINPPSFLDPQRFLNWLSEMRPEYIHSNNLVKYEN